MRRVSRIKKVCLLLLAGLAGGAGYFYFSYRGFTRAALGYARHASLSENRNLYYCLDYWFEFVGKVRPDGAGLYGFDAAAEDGLDRFERGRLLYHRGDFARAAGLIERDMEERGESEEKLFWLAVSYMRLAEAENCLPELVGAGSPGGGHGGHGGDGGGHALSCVLPLERFHERPARARQAARLFERLLDAYDRENRLYRWLLNFNLMAAGAYPSEVPGEYRIGGDFVETFYGARRREREAQFGRLRFDERARELGVATYNAGRGVAVEDFDGDGYLDIVAGGGSDPIKFYRNDRGARFEEVTEAFGLGGVRQTLFVTAADYDNDGWVDLFVAHAFGADHRLLRNEGGRGFADVTDASGLANLLRGDRLAIIWAPAWGDVDGDGDLDLFLAQMGTRIPFTEGLLARPRMDSKLLINDANRFSDRTGEYGLAGVVEDQFFIGAAFGDADADGYPELFLSSPFPGASVLLRNRGGRSYVVSDGPGRVAGGFAAAFLDVNHDGRLDIFQGGFADARTSTEGAVFGEGSGRARSGSSAVMLQTADGRFAEREGFFDMAVGTMGSSYGDLDNDGCHDFYLGTGTPEGWFVLPNLMYLGRADGALCAEATTNVSMLGGFGTTQKGHGVVFFDFDEDGDQDVYSSLGGMWQSDRWPNQFFVNRGRPANGWVKIRLRGRSTNRLGVGATVKVVAERESGGELVRYAQVDQKTGFGSAPYLAHVGLLDAALVKEVRVYWPGSRVTKSYAARLRELNVLDEDGGAVVSEAQGGAP